MNQAFMATATTATRATVPTHALDYNAKNMSVPADLWRLGTAQKGGGRFCRCEDSRRGLDTAVQLLHTPGQQHNKLRRIHSERTFITEDTSSQYVALDARVQWEKLVPPNANPIHSCYILKALIGEGTWGAVHLAIERQSGLTRAIKKIPKRRGAEMHRFRQEVKMMRGLDHPNIVTLYETFEDYANIFLVMEHCKGGELFQRLADSRYFSEQLAASIVRQMLSAICYCHSKNIAHRDIKPENFLFLSEDDHSPIKLIDFGLAKLFSMHRKMKTKVGTLYYAAPQVLRGQYTSKCDLWSIGVVMYILLTGVPPFNGVTETAIVDQILKSDANFNDERLWTRISKQGKDLIRRLLCRNEEGRLTAEEALRHDWFALFAPRSLARLGVPRSKSMPNRMNETGTGMYRRLPLGDNFVTSSPNNVGHAGNSSADDINDSAFVNNSQRASAVPVVVFDDPLSDDGLIPAHTVQPHPGSTVSEVQQKVSFAPVEGTDVSPQYTTAGTAGNMVNRVDVKGDCSGVDSHSELELLEESLMSDPTTRASLDSVYSQWGNLAARLVPKWRRFAKHNKLKKAALSVIARQMANSEELSHLRELFLALDVGGDGTLTKWDMTDGIRALDRMSQLGQLAQLIRRATEPGTERAQRVASHTGTGVECGDDTACADTSVDSRRIVLEDDGSSVQRPYRGLTTASRSGLLKGLSTCGDCGCLIVLLNNTSPKSGMGSVRHRSSIGEDKDHCSTRAVAASSYVEQPSLQQHQIEIGTSLLSHDLNDGTRETVDQLSDSSAACFSSQEAMTTNEPLVVFITKCDDNTTTVVQQQCVADVDMMNNAGTTHNSTSTGGSTGGSTGIRVPKGAMEESVYGEESDDRMTEELADEMLSLLQITDRVHFSEFLAACLDQNFYMRENLCRAAFRLFDRDSDGYISRGELREALGWNDFQPLLDGAMEMTAPQYDRIREEERKAAAEGELDVIMSMADADGDGKINFEDFLQLLTLDASSTRYFDPVLDEGLGGGDDSDASSAFCSTTAEAGTPHLVAVDSSDSILRRDASTASVLSLTNSDTGEGRSLSRIRSHAATMRMSEEIKNCFSMLMRREVLYKNNALGSSPVSGAPVSTPVSGINAGGDIPVDGDKIHDMTHYAVMKPVEPPKAQVEVDDSTWEFFGM